MQYNLYIRTGLMTYNIFGISNDQLLKVVDAYLRGKESITLAGTKHSLKEMKELKIFTYTLNQSLESSKKYYLGNINYRKQRRGQRGYFLPITTLKKMGNDLTYAFLEDSEYGQDAEIEPGVNQISEFVSKIRLKELIELPKGIFDLKKLIQLCQELNINYENRNYLSIGMISRAIIDHVPPIFNFKTFDEVSANYGGSKSFKKSMQHLNNSLRSIADSFLHQTIREKETLPTEVQIDFKQDLDVLLGEIVRVLK